MIRQRMSHYGQKSNKKENRKNSEKKKKIEVPFNSLIIIMTYRYSFSGGYFEDMYYSPLDTISLLCLSFKDSLKFFEKKIVESTCGFKGEYS